MSFFVIHNWNFAIGSSFGNSKFGIIYGVTKMFGPGLYGYWQSAGYQLFNLEIKTTEKYIAEESEEKKLLDSPEKVKLHAERMRNFFLDAIGQVPDDGSELNPQITGTIRREKYRIEKVIFQSLEDNPVTANLYVPEKLAGPAPAVLHCCGHSREAKSAEIYHKQSMMLAKNGFVVLNFDPPGQGERVQLIDRKSGAQIVQWGTTEHSYIGLVCEMLGQNICRYFIRDAMRGIDYLRSREEVDNSRIGITGTSGGGTQSCYMMIADQRIAAAAPSCYVTDRLSYMKAFQAHDAEQNIFGHIPVKFNYSDFLIAFAPKPLLLVGVKYDFFPIEGLLKSYEVAKNIYGVLGAENQCNLALDENTHNLTFVNRVAITKFFAESLAGTDTQSLDLRDDEPLSPDELRCTSSGEVMMDFPEKPNLLERVVSDIPEKSRLTGEALRARVRELVLHDREQITIRPRIIINEVDQKNLRTEKLFFFSEPDILVAGEIFRPAISTGRIPLTIALLPEGTSTTRDELTMTMLAKYWTGGGAVLVADPRGIGSVKAHAANPNVYNDIYGTQFTLSYNAWMLGDNLVCMRAYDILRTIELMRTRDDIDPERISLVAKDDQALPALLAAAADGKLASAEFENLPESYSSAIRKIYYDRKIINEWTTIHGMLAEFDIPDLIKLV